MLDDALFEKRAQASKRRKFNFPEPIFPNIVNVGNLSGVTMLEQILEQLGVDEDDYLSWSSKGRIKVNIGAELYKKMDPN